jgi:hypothetical protein
MKVCPSCNEQHPDSSTFCGNDGMPLKTVVSPGASSPACKACGESLEPGAKFCPECGVENSSGGLVPPESLEFPKEKQPTPRFAQSQENEAGTFAEEVAAVVARSFPDAIIRNAFGLRSRGGKDAEIDVLVITRAGVFLIECENYLGKIRGSMAYDYKKGELWTCQTPSGNIIEIFSGGKNPAQEALDRVDLVRGGASATWLKRELSYIHSVLVFPDGAELSELTGLSVSPARSSPEHAVAALTLSQLSPYVAGAVGYVSEERALALIDHLEAAEGVVAEGAMATTPEWHATTHVTSKDEKLNLPIEPERKRGVPVNKRLYLIGGAIAAGVLLLLVGWQTLHRLFTTGAPDVVELNQNENSGATASSSNRQPTSADSPSALVPPEEAPSPSVSTQPGQIQPVEPTGEFTRAKQTADASKQTRGRSPTPQESAGPVYLGGPESVEVTRGNPRLGEAIAPREKQQASVKEARVVRRPAEPGLYETIKSTAARTSATDSAETLDRLNPGTRLNVTGSEGDWLVVFSRTRNRTVYVRRDDAMLIEARIGSAPAIISEAKAKEVENQIQQAITQRGITGVSVSFLGDTAYLRGTVQSEDERFAAELAARSFPEVIHINNGIRLNR